MVSNITGALKFVAEFSKTVYTVNVQNDTTQGLVQRVTGSDGVSLDETVQYTVTPKSGWKVQNVTFNGQSLEKNADGTYSVTVVDGENKLAVSYAKVEVEASKPEQEPSETPPSDTPPSDEPSSDTPPSDTSTTPAVEKKSKGLGALFIALASTLLLSGVVMIVILKKDKKPKNEKQ